MLFFVRLQEAVQVGFGVFLFCDISIVGISAIAWLVFLAIDPQHAPIKAALAAVGFSRIPLEVTTGLAVFFAAVNWHSTQSEAELSSISVRRRLIEIERLLGLERDREVS